MDSGKKNGEHQPRMQGDHERETESQQQRVSHPAEAKGRSRNPGENRKIQKVINKKSVTPGRRIQETLGKQKVNNKESVTPGRKIQEPRGKQRVNNKESGSPESRKEDQGNHGKKDSQQQTVPQGTQKQP